MNLGGRRCSTTPQRKRRRVWFRTHKKKDYGADMASSSTFTLEDSAICLTHRDNPLHCTPLGTDARVQRQSSAASSAPTSPRPAPPTTSCIAKTYAKTPV
ncbi:hypothetical protein CRUP_029929 [Coryphaenoides rupestris]|nr:hypothetical protein CRUP_029929 [Coryphaenoides rupestris]